ncbi:MAG TPA: tetratricopeptide repeat protein, partial [Desulfobacteraceae bacterium]|nr:tetratricopeptide repeat protein [Desulfobacteraceae bacterium]
LLFFILFIVFSKGFFELLYYLFIPYTLSEQNTFLYLGLSIPAVFSLIIYFRYLVGFFMRNLERQADAYSAHIMGDPTHTILSLEKIALLSGRIRDLPSWHHFSIKERVEFLNRFFRDPMLLRRHTRFLILCLFLYLLGFSLLIYGVNSTAIRRAVILDSASKLIRSSRVDPKKDLNLFIDVAMIYHDMGEIKKAVSIYEEILRSYKDAHIALNNLAWIFATTDKEELRDPKRALMLAKRAVSLKRCAEYLDTLAEAYWINGMRNEAIRAEEEALEMAKEGRDYYMAQLKRFKKALPYSTHYSNYNNS